jgi:hypothetical protein
MQAAPIVQCVVQWIALTGIATNATSYNNAPTIKASMHYQWPRITPTNDNHLMPFECHNNGIQTLSDCSSLELPGKQNDAMTKGLHGDLVQARRCIELHHLYYQLYWYQLESLYREEQIS